MKGRDMWLGLGLGHEWAKAGAWAEVEVPIHNYFDPYASFQGRR